MPSIRISRQFINAEVYGEGRRTAVFLHGLGPGALAWRQVAEGVPASHRALAIDLPGFGESERGSFQGAVDEAATIVHHTLHGHGDLSPVDLVGHDYGGLVALDFAARYPSHVRRLLLVGAAAFVRDVKALGALSEDVTESGWDAERAASWLQSQLTEELASAHFEALRDAAAQVAPDLMRNCLHSLMRAQYLDVLTDLDVPLVLVRGASDSSVTEDDLAIVAARAGDTALETIPDVGHWPHVEAPSEVLAVISKHCAP